MKTPHQTELLLFSLKYTHYNNNPNIKSLQVVKKFDYKIISAFKPAGKLQKTGVQHTQCNMGGHIDLEFPLASGLFKNCQL